MKMLHSATRLSFLAALLALPGLGSSSCNPQATPDETDQLELLGLSTTAEIAPEGGSIALDRVARVDFASGTFSAPTTVEVLTSDEDPTADLYELTSSLFAAGRRSVFETRVRVSAEPQQPVTIELNVPRSMGPANGVMVLAEVLEGNDLDIYDRFVPIVPSAVGADTIRVSLSPSYFFDGYGEGDATEAVFVLARMPSFRAATAALSISPFGEPRAQGAAPNCPAGVNPIYPPLRQISRRRGFNPGTETVIDGKKIVGHPGTDFVASDGTEVVAAGDGTVVAARESNGGSLTADNGGAGGTIVIEIPGSGRVQYMHLKAGTLLVQPGDTVRAGQKIAEADNTGYSTGSHLHFEFRPNTAGGQRIDPELCIDPDLVPPTPPGQTYNLNFNHRQRNVLLGNESEVSISHVSGTARFDLLYEIPAGVPGYRPHRLYQAAALQDVSVLEFNSPSETCSLPTITNTVPLGYLIIYTDDNTYRVGLDISAYAEGTCTRRDTGQTLSAGRSVMSSNGYDLAYPCEGIQDSEPEWDSGFASFSLGSGTSVSQQWTQRCTDSDGSYDDLESSWTLDRVN